MSAMEFMELAAQKARESVANGWGGPFGAVIVRDGQVLAVGQNRVLLTGDPTAHAEVDAIRRAAMVAHRHAPAISGEHFDEGTLALVPRPPGSADPAPLRSRMLMGADIYATGFPCPMCLGAIYWARLDRIYYACGVEDARAIGFDDAFQYEDLALPASQRRVPATQVGRELGMSAFEAWAAKPDAHPY